MGKLVMFTVSLLLVLGLMGVGFAWEPDDDFDWEAPYEISANCGGGCHIQFGKVYLDNGDSDNSDVKMKKKRGRVNNTAYLD